ncbi:MAG: aromatic ring-hydroxylating dioxygenase subunit alpha [Candidatus Pacebacteria bacterium]|nr:aromatic ring-hydroxylating dioxygenase subunit alpha [Candidatus Paceibacterota bacterium]
MRATDHWLNASLAASHSGQSGIDNLPRGLPPWAYNHPDLFEIELERIIRPSWQIVGHVNAIPKTGDYLTVTIGPDSIMVVRDKQGKIHAHHNICRHRGARLVQGESGNCGASVVCPYHGWAYDHSGSLRALPVSESFPEIDRSHYGLYPVSLEIVMGLIFVAIKPPDYSVTELWRPMMEMLAPYRIEEMVPSSELLEMPWEINWKIAMDNYLESYHVPVGHPGLFRMFIPDYEQQDLLENGLNMGVAYFRDELSSNLAERIYQTNIVKYATHLSETDRRSWRFISMLPNMGIDIYPEQLDFFQILPSGPRSTLGRWQNFGLPDERPEMKTLRYLSTRISAQVQAEDDFLCAIVQENMKSSVYQPGPISRIESCVIQFHDRLRDLIPELKSNQVPKHFA